MKPKMQDLMLPLRRAASQLVLAAPLLLSAFSGSGCQDPKQDDFQSKGGIAADPEGIMQGSVVYLGPRPKCEYADGKPTRVRGRVILTLFEYDNPPPPAGRATSALNLLAISGSKVFSLDDCLPDGDPTNPAEKITRSVPFEWPTIALNPVKSMEYQVRGFYDFDEDMNPFFSVKRLPTAGDIVGVALNDVTDPGKGLLRIQFPSREDAKNGFVRSGVTVALGSYVWTELPAFQLDPKHRALNAQSFIDPVIDFAVLRADVPATVRRVWNLTCSSASPPDTCGLSLQSLKESVVGDTFAEAGIELDFDPKRYAWFVEPVDIRTVNMGAPDTAVPDGLPDPHPLLGSSLGVAWSTPIVLFLRRATTTAQGKIEALAKLPSVTLVGSVLPDEVAIQRTFVGSMNIAVPPLAVVDLNPASTACRVPYAAPGNLTPTFEDRIAQCSDLPTGVFAINVLHGVAGGVRVNEPDATISENGVLIEGGGPSGQVWSVPNELAEPVQVGKDYVLQSQGGDGMFVVHDPEPTKTGNCKVAKDPAMQLAERPVNYRGICKAGDEPINENPVGVDNVGCLPSLCCDAVRHLCDVPLCAFEKVNGLNVRTSPTKIVKEDKKNGYNVPDCVPFAMPDLCCARK